MSLVRMHAFSFILFGWTTYVKLHSFWIEVFSHVVYFFANKVSRITMVCNVHLPMVYVIWSKKDKSKVKTLWEDHKIWKKSPSCFDKYLVNQLIWQNKREIFFKFFLAFSEKLNFNATCQHAKISKLTILRAGLRVGSLMASLTFPKL